MSFNAELYIKESNAIEGIYAPEEIEQSLIAWEFIGGLETISHSDIKNIQGIITKNQSDLPDRAKGVYRDAIQANVRVGGRYAPEWSYVPKLMDRWLEALFSTAPIISHINFEVIHPFADGNGRTGRMIYWWHCLKAGIEPTLYTGDDRATYYSLFSEDLVMQLSNANWKIEPEDLK